jgi:hypothetical protein
MDFYLFLIVSMDQGFESGPADYLLFEVLWEIAGKKNWSLMQSSELFD